VEFEGFEMLVVIAVVEDLSNSGFGTRLNCIYNQRKQRVIETIMTRGLR